MQGLRYWRLVPSHILPLLWVFYCEMPRHPVVEPPRVRVMHGVTTHVSDPDKNVAWMAAIYKRPDVLASPPFFPRISKRRASTFCAFQRLLDKSDQSPYTTISIQTRYNMSTLINDGKHI